MDSFNFCYKLQEFYIEFCIEFHEKFNYTLKFKIYLLEEIIYFISKFIKSFLQIERKKNETFN